MGLLVARRPEPAKLARTISRRALSDFGWMGPWLLALVVSACSLGPPPLQRAALLADRGRSAEAIRVLVDYLAAHPDAQEERKLLIRLHGSTGHLDAAAAQTERLAELLPLNSPVPWVELGAAYELAHRYDEALAAYDRAARVSPGDPVGVKMGGMRAARWGELELAGPRLREAVRRAPRDAEAWHALGVVEMSLGELEAAKRAYATGISVDPQALENRLGLATVALRLQQPQSALEQYELLLEARPEFRDALLGKSWSLILMGELERARSTLSQAAALRANPDAIARQRAQIEELERKAQGGLGGSAAPAVPRP